jgi:hypothetical protein
MSQSTLKTEQVTNSLSSRLALVPFMLGNESDNYAKAFEQFYREVAQEMGWRFQSYKEHYPQADREYNVKGYLVHPTNGEKLYLSPQTWGAQKDTLNISGQYPTYSDRKPVTFHNEPGPSINVGPTQSPAQVAKQINRRLLADYQQRLRRVRQAIEENEGWMNGVNQLHDQVAATLGPIGQVSSKRTGKESHPEVSIKSATGGGNYGSVHINSGTSISLELHSMRPDDALALLALLRERREARNK